MVFSWVSAHVVVKCSDVSKEHIAR